MPSRTRAAMTLAAAVALTAGLSAVAATAAPGGSAPGTSTGPSSSQSPYLVRTVPGITTTSALTVGDRAQNGYRMVGIPDGLGGWDNGDGTFTLLMNHELGGTAGVARAHGSTGAFVSRWIIDSTTLAVRSGEDLITKVMLADGTAGTWTAKTTAFSRFCSANLADPSAFYDAATGLGTTDRIFLTGEENGAEGRAFAHVATGAQAGTSYQLPWLGHYSFENVLAKPGTGAETIVVGTDDSGGGQVYVYVGTKRATGNPVERAGLVGGELYGLKIDDVATETDATAVPATGARFSLVHIPGAAAMTGAQLETASKALGVSSLARPEDGSWDPTDPKGFYVNTTGSFTGISRLWHLSFADPSDVTKGGTATVPVSSPAYDAAAGSAGQRGPRMMDNMTVNSRGQVLLQEDPGGQDYLAGLFQYDPASKALAKIAQHDPNRFAPGAKNFLTRDEESSGIIPAPWLGAGKYLLDVQAHYATDAETVEGGQLLVLSVPPGKPVR